ncbi:hypothetical protein KL86DPRO_11703 [uncultured delta proteobacterium]|uniref:Uncharacterized protein n=1 Tax=uncultured delta proteobacterium TaxID=34034 RepID=A0A212JKM5_9DELT|nr:hypothetical protein KL86DPRO_11703 [uncultured delta proteobacterium]
MNTKLEKLTEMVWQNMAIDANDEHVLVEVELPVSITEWFTESDLTHFVANLIPLYDWQEGILKLNSGAAEHIYVMLWWSFEGEPLEPYLKKMYENVLLAEQSEGGDYGDDGNLYLEDEGCERLCEMINDSFDIDEEGQFAVVTFNKDLFRLMGKETLTSYVNNMIPDWDIVDCIPTESGESYELIFVPEAPENKAA